VLEDDTGEQCMPHRAHRVVIAPVAAHDLEVLHHALVGEMINEQLQSIEVATRLERVPREQVRLCYGRHGVSSLRVVSSTTMIPWWPPFFIHSVQLGWIFRSPRQWRL
jgi:hypothetical protein